MDQKILKEEFSILLQYLSLHSLQLVSMEILSPDQGRLLLHQLRSTFWLLPSDQMQLPSEVLYGSLVDPLDLCSRYAGSETRLC